MMESVRKLAIQLVELIEEQLDEHRVLGVVLAPLALVSLLVTLGVLPNGLVAIRLGVGLLVAVLLIALGFRNRQHRATHAEQRRQLIDFADALVDSDALQFDLPSWAETHVVSKDSCTTTRTIVVRNTGSSPLLVCWHQHKGPFETDDLPKSARRKVRLRVAEKEGDEQLVDCPVTIRWFGPQLRAYVRFQEAIQPGDDRTIQVEIDWPGWRTPILDDRQDRYEYIFHRTVGKFEFHIEFNSDVGLDHELRVQSTGGLPRPESALNSGKASVDVTWDNPVGRQWAIFLQK